MNDHDHDVLVVEDDPEINDLVGAYVELAGFHPRPALNGKDALREAHAHHPSLIILDLMLPDIDGFEVCRRLRSDPSTWDVPVLILSALGRDDCQRKAQGLGVACYLTKPFDPDQLIEAVRANAKVQGHSPVGS
jgi:DNA-binding response OmpR family regulator